MDLELDLWNSDYFTKTLLRVQNAKTLRPLEETRWHPSRLRRTLRRPWPNDILAKHLAESSATGYNHFHQWWQRHWRLTFDDWLEIMSHEESTGTLNLIPRQKDSIFSLCLLSFSPSGHCKFFFRGIHSKLSTQDFRYQQLPRPMYINVTYLPCHAGWPSCFYCSCSWIKWIHSSGQHSWMNHDFEAQSVSCLRKYNLKYVNILWHS